MGIKEVIYLDLFHHAAIRKQSREILEEGDLKIPMRKYQIKDPALLKLWNQLDVNEDIRKIRKLEDDHQEILTSN